MLIEGEKEEIKIVVDSTKRHRILNMLMSMDGVKTIEREGSDVKLDSLSIDTEREE